MSTGILPAGCLSTAFLYCYAIIYSAVVSEVLGVHIVGVGWINTMVTWVLISYQYRLWNLILYY